MKNTTHRVIRSITGIALLGVCLVGLWAVDVSAQGRQIPPGRQGGPGPGPGRLGRQGPPAGVATPADIQKLLDAFVLVRAQQELQLSDEQFQRFLPRLTALLAVRSRAQNQRSRAVMELRRMVQGGPRGGLADEAQVAERLKALDDMETQAAAEDRQARAELNQTLTTVQRARFRLLEEQVERQKLDLLSRSRQPPAGRQPEPQ